MTLLTAGALTDPNVCTTDARLGGVGRVPPPPQTKILATPVGCLEKQKLQDEARLHSLVILIFCMPAKHGHLVQKTVVEGALNDAFDQRRDSQDSWRAYWEIRHAAGDC